MTNAELIELVSGALKRDNSAMEQLYKAYYTDIFYVCKKYNLNDADANDIAQETFIQAFDKLSTLDNATKFSAWLQRIASNKCLNLLKHNNVLTIESMYNENDEVIEIAGNEKATEDIVVDKEVQDILVEMMSKLPIEQRVTLFMFYYQEYSIKEIAEAYGCSENTVKSRLNYAKKAIRVEVEKLEDKGIKLRAISILPFLYVLFKNERDAFACEIPDSMEVISEVMGHAVKGAVAAEEATAGNAINGMVASTTAGNTIDGMATSVTVGNAIDGMATSVTVGNAIDGMATSVTVGNTIDGMKTGGAIVAAGLKTGISKGLIAAISAVAIGVVGIVIAIIIATSGGDDNDENLMGKVTTEQTTTNKDVNNEDKDDEDKGDVEKETTTKEDTTTDIEKDTTEKVTEAETTTEAATEEVETLERWEVESVDFVPDSVVTDDETVLDFFYDHTEKDVIEWYKSKGYYDMGANPKVTIKGSYGKETTAGIREYSIANTRVDEETGKALEYASIYIKTGSYSPDEPTEMSFLYEGELEDAVNKVTEFLEFVGLGSCANDLIHAKDDVYIIPVDGKGKYTVDPYYHYDKYEEKHILYVTISFYDLSLSLYAKNKATELQYVEEFVKLSDYLTESKFDTTSIETFKNDLHKYIVAEIDPACLATTHILTTKYTYEYYPESGEKGDLELEYETDFLQEGVTFDNNRLRIGFRDNGFFIKMPVNAVFDHSVLEFEDMTEEDYVKTSEARLEVLKQICPSIDVTVDELVKLLKDKAEGVNTTIEFEVGGNKYTVYSFYDVVCVGIDMK